MNNLNPPVKIPKARLTAGVIVFITGFLMPLLVPFVAKMDISPGLKTTISGLLILGIPELFMLITVAILGKDGYNYLKARIFALFKKYGPPQTVSKLRYRVGLVLFIVPLFLAWLFPYVDQHIPFLQHNELYVNIGGDVLLFISLIVLGGDFWDKLRELFIYQKQISSNRLNVNNRN